MGGGPRAARPGSTLSKPLPVDPNRKYSASKYSRFKGNSKRSMSVLDRLAVEFTMVEEKRRKVMVAVAKMVVTEEDGGD
ncbi:hypothetical protein Hanom_Chr05g00436811 [Helianthus anomalus]